jgi:hypothetical protein
VGRIGGGEFVDFDEVPGDRDAEVMALMIAARRSASAAGIA